MAQGGSKEWRANGTKGEEVGFHWLRVVCFTVLILGGDWAFGIGWLTGDGAAVVVAPRTGLAAGVHPAEPVVGGFASLGPGIFGELPKTAPQRRAPRTNAAVSSPETAPPANPTMSAATTQSLVPLAAVAAAARPVAPLAAACCDTPRQIPRPRARANRAKVFFSLPKKLRGLVVIGPGDFPFHRGEQHAPRLPAAQQEIAHPHIREQPVVSPIQKFLIRQLVFA